MRRNGWTMSTLIQSENAGELGEPEPTEAAMLKVVLEPLRVEVACTVSERQSARIAETGGAIIAKSGPILMIWVGTSLHLPIWAVVVLTLVMVSSIRR
jgi:hypothetical protein